MCSPEELYIGLDLGTTGVRAVAADGTGAIVGSASAPFASSRRDRAKGIHEQDALEWLSVGQRVLRDTVAQALRARPGATVSAVSVDGTSGSLVAVDSQLRPLSPAMMYDDSRSDGCAGDISQAAGDFETRMGYRFSGSFAAPKALWMLRSIPSAHDAAWFLGEADFFAGHLLGGAALTDTSNALKMGYDLDAFEWPEELARAGVPTDRFPPVAKSGSVTGTACEGFRDLCGLAESTRVIAGLTDSTAGLLATGATRPGQMATTIGTTLAVKLVWPERLIDPQGRIYCHWHPDGAWLPGGASNTGAAALLGRFQREQLDALAKAAPDKPTGLLIYPLSATGERMPIRESRAARFIVGAPRNDAELYRGYLEGLAYVERLCVEVLEELGGRVDSPVWSAGGGAVTLANRIRASVLTRDVVLSGEPSSAFGSAILAASGRFGSVAAATGAMLKVSETRQPEDAWTAAYEDFYGQWKTELKKRGWLKTG